MTHTVTLTSEGLCIVDGVTMPQEHRGQELLTHLYRAHVGDYPKFFKMDALCKVGFVASELLLAAEHHGAVDQRPGYGGSQRGVLLFSRSGCLAVDTAYQATIQDPDNYYPSPALFVYTLPNILTGEIAIRNRYYGETNCILLPQPDPEAIDALVRATLESGDTSSLLTGWIECPNPDNYNAELTIIEAPLQPFNLKTFLPQAAN